ncbi:MAG TPA: cell division protein ZapA, partial [Stellaceae bacterium]|nr:cell division protein ZapA [Stellaceae bacterium]
SKVSEFTKTVGQVGEARLLLLAALVIADELSDANEAVQAARGRPGLAGGEADAAAASGIDNLAQRIESIAARLESS